jgi:lipoyl(octanoyl) transferase
MTWESLRFFMDREPHSAAMNMAIDEALLFAETNGDPILRCYCWRAPSVSFGYFTHWKSVVDRYRQWDLVRRWTGGGIVEHAGDFTYSLILPAGKRLLANRDLYSVVHTAIAKVLRAQGHKVGLTKTEDTLPSDACFERAVEFDVKLEQLKVAGAAIRRHRRGVLLQGSIQGMKLSPGFGADFAVELSDRVVQLVLTPSITGVAERLALEKYGSLDWTRRF